MATHSSILIWRMPWTEEPGYGPWDSKELDMTEHLAQPHTLSIHVMFLAANVLISNVFFKKTAFALPSPINYCF